MPAAVPTKKKHGSFGNRAKKGTNGSSLMKKKKMFCECGREFPNGKNKQHFLRIETINSQTQIMYMWEKCKE